MSSSAHFFVLNNIKIPFNASIKEAFSVAQKRLRSIGVNPDTVKLSVYKRSTDARNKKDIKFVYSILASGVRRLNDAEIKRIDASEFTSVANLEYKFGTEDLSAPPLIVGAGPAGMFAALILAEAGYKPTLIERGASVAERKRIVDTFKLTGILDIETNIQFGAGGAGTFSDGKLVTRINDPLCSYVMQKFVEFGAPEEILYLAKPHIGTDVLSVVVERMLSRVEELGGRVLYNTKYLKSRRDSGTTVAQTTSGDIKYGALILAVGHSARDTYFQLLNDGYIIEPKSMSVGMRIEHLSSDIDKAMYGDFAGHEALGRAEYNLSYNTKERGVYTFCMCPGGEVVPAASEDGGLVVNGMSYHARDGVNSNSAVVCSIFKEDYGATAAAAIEFQRKIERASFKSAGSDFSAPIITVGDFLLDECKREPSKIFPTYRGGKHVKLTKPSEYLPDVVVKSIKNALLSFDRKIEGFASSDAVLTGAETRTSSPIRIIRDQTTRLAPGFSNVYPTGEGAGYAGGITSAAIDGIKTALAVIERFKP